MSYPVELEEISTEKLKEELRRRRQAAASGCCAYCGRQLRDEPNCKMRDMHLDIEGK